METKFFKNVPIEVPLVPNFIRVGKDMFPIKDFTEEELKDIGNAWTKKLLEKAKKN